ncbi:hypothetical protein Tco_1407725 [Tanacetum coccineum]
MASMNTRLNIKKLDGNIIQKHGVGFKQLGPGVEIGVHGVQDEKRIWFEVELQGAQGDREAEGFHVSNDDAAVAQRRLIALQINVLSFEVQTGGIFLFEPLRYENGVLVNEARDDDTKVEDVIIRIIILNDDTMVEEDIAEIIIFMMI